MGEQLRGAGRGAVTSVGVVGTKPLPGAFATRAPPVIKGTGFAPP